MGSYKFGFTDRCARDAEIAEAILGNLCVSSAAGGDNYSGLHELNILHGNNAFLIVVGGRA